MRNVAAILIVAAGPAAAGESGYWGDGYWEYGDWRVSVSSVSEDGETWTTCEIFTGGDGEPTLSVVGGVMDGGGLHEPLTVWVSEYSVRNGGLAMVDGSRTGFLFDDGALYPASISVGQTDDGPEYRVGRAMVDPEATAGALGAMMRGNMVHVGISPQWTQPFSLKGFTAALGKLAERCEFRVADQTM